MQSYDIFLIDSGLITKLTFIVLGTRLGNYSPIQD